MTTRTMKSIYQLHSKCHPRPTKPEYAMTGIMVGIVVGWIVGFGLELVYHKHTILMIGAAIAGLALGAGFEVIRFRWRMNRFRTLNETRPRHLL